MRKIGINVHELDSFVEDKDNWSHRRPYLYLPERDEFFWGTPGSYHTNLQFEVQEKLEEQRKLTGRPTRMGTRIFGSYYTDPNTGENYHGVHTWTVPEKVQGTPEWQNWLDRAGQVVGTPVDPDVDPELWAGSFGAPGLADPAFMGFDPTASMQLDPNPKDEWWKVGCPSCNNPELETHLHGGLSCTNCGQEYEQMPDGTLISSIPPEPTGELWPDVIPWSEKMQDYYRQANLTVNPVNYEFVPLTEGEMARKQGERGADWNWSLKARRHNKRDPEGHVSPTELFALTKRYEFNCAYCGKPLQEDTITFDHVVPLRLGGSTDVSNLLPTCLPCNKGMDEWDWRLHPEKEVRWQAPEEFARVAAMRIGEQALEILHREGGFSLNADGSSVAPGYYTSVEGHQRLIPVKSIDADTINNYIQDHQDLLNQEDNFLGAWVSNGQVYLDISRSFQTEEEAHEFGAANHQEAMWDGFNNVEIPIRYATL